MKLSEYTLKILKNFLSINQSVKFEGNRISTKHGKNIAAYAKITENFVNEVAIYDLASFLRVTKFYEGRDADYDFQDKKVVITSGGQKTEYFYCEPNIIENPPEHGKLSVKNPLINFDFTLQQLKELKDIAGAINAADLLFLGDKNKSQFSIKVYDYEKQSKPVHEIDILTNTEIQNFEVSLKIEKLKLLDVDYNVLLNDTMIHFNNAENELDYFISTNILED